MRKLVKTLEQYHKNHSKPINNLAHQFAIPMILFGGFMFLGWFQIRIFGKLDLDFAWIGAFALAGFYFTLDVKIGGMSLVAFIIFKLLAGLLGGFTPTFFGFILMLALTGGGVALMVYGHQQQRNHPKPIDYLCGILVGPFVMLKTLAKELNL